MEMRQVRKERTGWRDEGISQRHRGWGWDCPIVDIDFLVLEYDTGKAVALIEYKHEKVGSILPMTHPSMKALKDLADKAEIYLFVVVYAGDFQWFRVAPINSKSHIILASTKVFTEMEYVFFLYSLRGRKPPNIPSTAFSLQAGGIGQSPR